MRVIARLRPLDPSGRRAGPRTGCSAAGRSSTAPRRSTTASRGSRRAATSTTSAASAIRRSGDFRGLWFADSDIYKVLEAVGWETGRAGDGGWSAFVDDTVALLREAQDDDGYLNSWIQGVHPEQRWQHLDESHELYCAGHLIQAAVAVARGAGRDDLLDVARRFADLAVRALRRTTAESRASTATRRSRRRSSSSPGTRATRATWRWRRRWSSGAAAACSAITTSARSTCRTTRPCARPPSRSATRCASSISRPA